MINFVLFYPQNPYYFYAKFLIFELFMIDSQPQKVCQEEDGAILLNVPPTLTPRLKIHVFWELQMWC